MPEQINQRPVFSLLEVAQSIKKTLSERYRSSFWVKAEMNKLNLYSHSGHCYPELVEKKEDTVVAQLKATLWKEDYLRINAHFQSVLNEPLKNGIKILFCARISFDASYGLSLQILDIDPAYTLGELEKDKAESIERLRKEGLFDLNKTLTFPLLPKRIAIISVETSKGYADFKNILNENQWGYSYFTMLFPALLQGEKAIPAICSQLEKIKKIIHHFDVVVIIRGGGGDVGLSCYNSYRLSREIAGFPIPVLTGIGHATNETVAEMVSFKNAITPTALANYLIQSFHNFSVPVQKAEELIRTEIITILRAEKNGFNRLTRDFKNASLRRLDKSGFEIHRFITLLVQQSGFRCLQGKKSLNDLTERIKKAAAILFDDLCQNQQLMTKELKKNTDTLLKTDAQSIINLERIVISMGPEQVLKRGFSITRFNGKSVKSCADVKENSMIETQLSDGLLISKIESKQSANNYE